MLALHLVDTTSDGLIATSFSSFGACLIEVCVLTLRGRGIYAGKALSLYLRCRFTHLPFSAPWLELYVSVVSMISTVSPHRVQLGLTAQFGVRRFDFNVGDVAGGLRQKPDRVQLGLTAQLGLHIGDRLITMSWCT